MPRDHFPDLCRSLSYRPLRTSLRLSELNSQLSYSPWRAWVITVVCVNPNKTSFNVSGNAMRSRHIPSPDSCSQSVLGGIGKSDSLGFGLKKELNVGEP